MLNSRLSFACLLIVVIGLSGCVCMDQRYEPSACNEQWDKVLGSCDQCGVCGGSCEGRTPCQSLKHVLSCGAGCGEIYWGEWISDPPDDCDPCDNCGNWVGPRCCPPTLWQRMFASGPCGCDVCCSEEAGYTEEFTEGEMVVGEEVMEGGEVLPQTTPKSNGKIQGQPKPATPPQPMRESTASHHTPVRRTPPQLIAPPHNHQHRKQASILKSVRTRQ